MKPRRPRPGARGGPTTSHRVGDEIRVKISELLLRDIRDQRLVGVHLTRVEMTRDLSLARIFWRPTPGGATIDAAAAGLEHASGFLRSRLGKALHLRAVPELRFSLDELPEQGGRMESLLATLVSGRSVAPVPGLDETDDSPRRSSADGTADDSDE